MYILVYFLTEIYNQAKPQLLFYYRVILHITAVSSTSDFEAWINFVLKVFRSICRLFKLYQNKETLFERNSVLKY